MHEDILEKINLPEGIEASLDSELKIKGPKGDLKRKFPCDIKIEGKEIQLSAKNSTRRGKKLIKTSVAHINNMIKGVLEGWNYKLQICSVHFPMNVKVENNEIIIKNFIGETKPRKAKIIPNVEVKIKGDYVEVFSIDKEAAGQTAANMEAVTKVKKKDRRVFQDGIWIIEKPGEKLLE